MADRHTTARKVIHLDDESHALAKAAADQAGKTLGQWVGDLILNSEAAKHRVPKRSKR